MPGMKWDRVIAALIGASAWAVPYAVMAQTLETAITQAYINNPTLNAERASNRATDELVPQALSGFRPQIVAGADAAVTATRSRVGGMTTSRTRYPYGVDLTITQNLFRGFQTTNQTRSAESQVLGAREGLRNTEQNVLLDAVTAFMDVIRDGGIVELQRQNLEALQEQLRATRDRFNVGELTRTDVAQAEARVAEAESALTGAQAQLNASRAFYRQVIGVEPGRLTPGRSAESRVPKSVDSALALGLSQHPVIQAARYGVDVAQLQVKVAEGALLPVVDLQGQLSRSYGTGTADRVDQASLLGRVTVPIYQGGGEYSEIRQSKEVLGQRRLEADIARDQVRAAVIQSFGLLSAARFQVEAAQAQIQAAQIALDGVREEFRVGQRTTLDVLNAQAELVSARAALITAQRDRVVNSYSLLAAVGKLSVAALGLRVPTYEPDIHYNQVRDSWFGIRTPDGR